MAFSHPTADQILALKINAGIDDLASHELFEGATPDVVQAVVEGIARFAESEWAPLDRLGDTQGAYCANGTVTLPEGYKEAYASYAGQGWNAIAAPTEFGGQGLPFSLSACVLENLGTANFGFSLLPLLSMGAAEAISHHASADQQATYLPKLLSGEWSGTMNLTEPQAGSDLGALRTTATPIESGEHAGKYKISGTKIFITFGEHDLAENIIQLVLARTPDAPAGSRGISMFIAPKFLPDADGNYTIRNDYRAVSIEHKMGIHISPTCVMSYGDNDNCVGELVGQENAGLRYMFTMMNNARVNVGNQGVQIAERATRQAIAFAQERVQSARAGGANRDPVAIIEHPDVRRMILRMRALTEAARALLYYTTGQLDRGSTGDEAAQMRGELLVPMLKAWASDIGCEVSSLGVQVHGGMGFVEETGAAQHYRDARIAPIYEGTNGIQAMDLVTRKLDMGSGAPFTALMGDISADCDQLPGLAKLADDCLEVGKWMLSEASLDDRLAGSVPFCTMCATAVAGWQLAKQVSALNADADPRAELKATLLSFFDTHIASAASGLKISARAGAEMLYDQNSGQLAG